jgi:hypothetical protein
VTNDTLQHASASPSAMVESDDVGIQTLLDASPELARLANIVGRLGGEEIARALAPLALYDLAQRAVATQGRNAERLWAPILAYARSGSTIGVPNVSITGSQVVIATATLNPDERATLLNAHRVAHQ